MYLAFLIPVHRSCAKPVTVNCDTRCGVPLPSSLRKLYERATTDRISAQILEQLRKDSQHSPFLLCTPVLSTKRRRVYSRVDDIETRIPTVVEQLRKWTSREAMGDVTVLPDASMRIVSSVTLTPDELSECGSGDDEPIDHRLPSPEEQLRIIASNDTSNAVASEEMEDSSVVRSQSSDLLKSSIDPVIKKGHFNSLKQWGKNRLKMIGRSPSASRDSFKDAAKLEKNKESISPIKTEEVNIKETVTLRKKRPSEEDRRSHQRCASYSSSEKSIGVPCNTQTTATINNGVKLRATSTQRRLRRTGLGKEEPHSSSGNWSASSESGRTSIGSEITTTTVPPKSTTSAGTSNNSLNYHHAPPSSIISRRRFINTSGSGSVTSEGTLTPDIIHDLHEDLETSSEFSCDTEGYYTSFHMDSGLKTLKEEDLSPSTPLHTSNALSNSSTSQNLTAENEYELFGKGSTSTTTSSAGTVCTTLMAAGSDRSLAIGPTVPERKSSLSKINRSRNNSVHSANASLDRGSNSYSKSPFSSLRYNAMKSYADKHIYNQSSPEINNVPPSTVTVSKSIGNHREITAVAEVHTETDIESTKKSTGTSSPDSGHNTSSSPIEDSVSSAHGKNSLSEHDYSESSDLEGTDRIERIRYKTTINSSRIPSMCVITPSNSDDESDATARGSEVNNKLQDDMKSENFKSSRPKLDLPSDDKIKEINGGYKIPKTQKSSLQPFNNLMCKLKGVLPHKLTHKKSPVAKETDDNYIFDTGDYVTIADVKNNNQKMCLNRGTYANTDIIGKNLQSVLSGKPETEYVSLNELPNCLTESKDYLDHGLEEKPSKSLEEIQRKGAKVTLDSHGQVIYSSDTLKRKKGAHTTFEPGPFVQEISPTTMIIQRENADVITVSDETDFPYEIPQTSSKPTSPQLGKMIIKAPLEPHGAITTEFVAFPPPKPSTIITATPLAETRTLANNNHNVSIANKHSDLPRVVDAITRTGAYVNIHDAEGVNLSPSKDDVTGKNFNSNLRSTVAVCSTVESVERSPSVSEEITPFIPNFQTPIMLKGKGDNNGNASSNKKLAEVLRIFSSKPNDENAMTLIAKNGNLKSISKIKRSDSYKLANSPLMPIKKLLKLEGFSNNDKKINSLEMIQAELAADLLREQINYPATVSPKAKQKQRSVSDNINKCECLDNKSYYDDEKFESELSALNFSPLTTPVTKRHTVSIPNNRDIAMDVLTAILDSDPDNVCILHSPPSCPLTPSKVTVPVDSPLHRARILSLSESDHGNISNCIKDKNSKTKHRFYTVNKKSSNGFDITVNLFKGYLHSTADKPSANGLSTINRDGALNVNALSSTILPKNNNRHGIDTYNNRSSVTQKPQRQFWTLPNRMTLEQQARSKLTTSKQELPNYPEICVTRLDKQISNNEDTIRISPIDPRIPSTFKSSTPTSKENVIDLNSKLLSPVKSTMTNEELYAVIHKSKKKLNIKEVPERAESPALSNISLSPVNSETSLSGKGTQRHPETGYLGDARSRASWSPNFKPLGQSQTTFGFHKQESTCADRHGPLPQTSRMDFKKLLLQHSVKLNTLNPQAKSNKLSAVEQLKLSKEKGQTPMTPPSNRSHVNILDLSGSPKTYAQRKIIRSVNQPLSPGRANALLKEHKNAPKILLSPKSQWRFSSPRSDVLSTPILEAYNEDENSNSSGEKHDTSPNPPSKTVPIITNQHFGARRNLIPINENNLESEVNLNDSLEHCVFPLNTECVKQPVLSRTEIMQAKRAEFFSSPHENPVPHLSSFKQSSPNVSVVRSKLSPDGGKTSPTTLETAL
ncbi:unnamed protein product [Leptidea sinapis]|uniref:WASP family protein member n=1 Tax=Leptidea sinapis TaxID=189913 RepID=A0A5E4QI32_9NEOP|nr:unnamed protein product [Leptidea sinapis]